MKQDLKNYESENKMNIIEINKLKSEIDLLNNKGSNFLKDKEQLIIKINNINEENNKLNQKIHELTIENNHLKKNQSEKSNKNVNSNISDSIHNSTSEIP